MREVYVQANYISAVQGASANLCLGHQLKQLYQSGQHHQPVSQSAPANKEREWLGSPTLLVCCDDGAISHMDSLTTRLPDVVMTDYATHNSSGNSWTHYRGPL
nr:hypothetical protein CFP56_20352 [Quercus suber]